MGSKKFEPGDVVLIATDAEVDCPAMIDCLGCLGIVLIPCYGHTQVISTSGNWYWLDSELTLISKSDFKDSSVK